MTNRLLVLNGHPDPSPSRFCAALASAYCAGAELAGWDVSCLDAGAWSGFSSFVCAASAERETLSSVFLRTLESADRLALVFPLWLGASPAELHSLPNRLPAAMRGDFYARIVRVIVTMDMPTVLYRGARDRGARRTFRTAALGDEVAGKPKSLIGCVSALSPEERRRRLAWTAAEAARDMQRAQKAMRRASLARLLRMSVRRRRDDRP